MASDRIIKAERRSDAGKGASRRLRRNGYVPAIIYGGGKAPVNLQVEQDMLIHAARKEWFSSSVIDLEVDGETQPVLVRDWQVHPYKTIMLHLDLMRVDDKAEITVNVPLHFLNQETSPAGKAADVIVARNLIEVEVACLSKDLPDNIEVDLADLSQGDIIHLSDLKLPEGVELVSLRHEGNDQPVVSAQLAKVEEEPSEENVESDEDSPEQDDA